MFKGLFNEKVELIIKGMKCKSYSKTHGQCAKLLAVCFATIALASCGNKTDNHIFQTDEEAANAYKSYLSEVRNMGTVSTGRLIESVNEWQILRDSVYASVAGDTSGKPHSNYEIIVQAAHDSLQVEFTRLALSKQRTFADALLFKEQTSRYRQDPELTRSAAEAEPFFKSLDSVSLYKGSDKVIIGKYRSFLSRTLKSGINDKDELLAFIKEEDRLFRSFLTRLPELAAADLSAITRDTEKCCLSVFRSAEDGRLSYRDALIYTAKRTNRRIVLNALVCCDDIDQNRVRSEEQARAYVWMLLQPYISLDGFNMTVMSETERIRLYEVANNTPLMIANLNKIIGTDNDQWPVLPGVLIKIMLTSI